MEYKKIAFNHEATNMPIAMGITDERADEIITAVHHANVDSKDSAEFAEMAMYYSKPTTPVEAFFVGYVMGRIAEKFHCNPFSALTKMLSGE